MKITVDSREQARLVQPLINEMLMEDRWKDVEVVRHKLVYGDYLLEDGKTSLIIERKTISDFVNSYAKGNLSDKLFMMRLFHDRTMLLLEGRYHISGDRIVTYQHHGVEYGMLRQTMLRFIMDQQDKGTAIWYTNNLDDTIYQIFLMAENLTHMEIPHPTCKCGKARELFLQLPGVGEKKLEKLMETYSTPLEALEHMEAWDSPAIKKALSKW